MGERKLDPRRAKVHRSYSVAEAAMRFGVHRNTIRNWIKRGLPIVRTSREVLLLGRDIRSFLEQRRERRKRKCGPGRLFCLRCREPRRPRAGALSVVEVSATSLNVTALCDVCGARMNRRGSPAAIAAAGFLALDLTRADSNLSDSASAPVNCHSERTG